MQPQPSPHHMSPQLQTGSPHPGHMNQHHPALGVPPPPPPPLPQQNSMDQFGSDQMLSQLGSMAGLHGPGGNSQDPLGQNLNHNPLDMM